MRNSPQSHDDPTNASETNELNRKPYEPPRVEKKRSLERVTLLTGMGTSAVGIINVN